MLKKQPKQNIRAIITNIIQGLEKLSKTKQTPANTNHVNRKVMEKIPAVVKAPAPIISVNVRYIISLNKLAQNFYAIIKATKDRILIIKAQTFRSKSDKRILNDILKNFDLDSWEEELQILAFYIFYEILCALRRQYRWLTLEEILKLLLGLINNLNQKALNEELKRKHYFYKKSLAFYLESHLLEFFFRFFSIFNKIIFILIRLFALAKTWLYNLLMKFINLRFFPVFLLEFRTLIIFYYFYFRRKRGRLRDLIIREFRSYGQPPSVIILPEK